MSSSKISTQQALDTLEVLLGFEGVTAAGITGKLARTGEGPALNLVVLLRDERYGRDSNESPFQRFNSRLRQEIEKLYRCNCNPYDDSGWVECEFCTGSWEDFHDSEEAMNRYYTKRHSEMVLDVLLDSLQLSSADRGWWRLATRGIPKIRAIVLPDHWKPEGYETSYDKREIEDLYPSSFNLSNMVRRMYHAYRLPYNGGLNLRQTDWWNHPVTWASYW